MRTVPWWGLLSSAAAPLFLVSGWTVAARVQPRPVDPVADTVSALAAVGVADRWVALFAFLGTTAVARRACRSRDID
jgi:hypothetical protein